MKIIPFKKSYWVVPGILLVGQVPTGKDLCETREMLKGLSELNVKVIINLMEHDEKNKEGKLFYNYQEDVQQLGIKMYRYPIKDISIPSKELMALILIQIELAIERNETVYIHCWGGVGRTGTVVGCLLKKLKYATNDNVFDFIEYLKRTSPMSKRMSPETLEQMNFVLDWK
jgi:protein-tyrosine phosphatase